MSIAPSKGPRSLETICAEILAKNDRIAPRSDEELAEIERRAELDRIAERNWKLQDAWRRIVSSRGERYADSRLANYECRCDAQTKALSRVKDFCERLPDYHREGRGLLLFGPAGTGKDHLQVAAMRYAILKHGMNVKWVNGMDLFGTFRDAIDSSEPETNIIKRYVDPEILAISDPLPPFGTLTEFQASMLFRIVDARYSRMRPTWATVNIKDGKEGSERLGSQILDRLKDGAVCVSCNWPSFREAAK